MSANKLKIGFITKEDPDDIATWSGIHYHILKSLQMHVGETVPLGPIQPKFILIHRITAKILSLITGKIFRFQYDLKLVKSYSKIFEKKIKKENFDILFSSLTIPEIAFLETNIPIIATTDANFKLLNEYYGGHSNLAQKTINNALYLEQKAFSKIAALTYPSNWVTNSVITDYNVLPEKVFTIPYGANMPGIPSDSDIDIIIENRLHDNVCRLLFIGRDWYRKGGDIAYRTLYKLRDSGIETELIVVGCKLPLELSKQYITEIPLLDKKNTEDLNKFIELFKKSNFFFLPSLHECYGIVFCEASAFGLPSIAMETGGVSNAVKNGENGFLLPKGANEEQYMQKILDVWKNKTEYKRLCQSSRDLYNKELNWDSWAKSVKSIVDQLLGKE